MHRPPPPHPQSVCVCVTPFITFILVVSCPAKSRLPFLKVKSCYNPLRLETVIVLVSSGIDFVNTPRLYSDRATR